MAKLNGTNPIGANILIYTPEKGEVMEYKYQVTLVSGVKKHVPSTDSIVYLEYIGRPIGSPTPYLAIPLEVFVQRTVLDVPRIAPVSKRDIFWEFPIVGG